MIELWNKHSRVGLHSERDNWLQTSALADSTELRYTENNLFWTDSQAIVTDVFFLTEWKIAILIKEIRWKMINQLYIPITKS